MQHAAHILVVEDEPSQREVMVYNLEAEGYRVTCADNGDDAMLVIAEDMPDVIVLDWMMPHLSGIEVCRQIKSNPDTRAIPVIMLSAKSDSSQIKIQTLKVRSGSRRSPRHKLSATDAAVDQEIYTTQGSMTCREV